MSFTRFEAWGVALVLSAGAAGAARAADCAATYAECKEDCSLEYGSIRVEMKRRFAQCLIHCDQEVARCIEQEVDDLPAPKKKKAKAKKKRMAADGREIEDVQPAQPAQRDSLKDDDVPISSQSTSKAGEKQGKEEEAPGKDDMLVPMPASSGAPRDGLAPAPLAKPSAGAPELEVSKPEGEKAPR